MSTPQQGGSPNNAILQQYQQWSDKTPFITRFTTVFVVVIYILSFFFSADSYLGNIPYFTIQRFEIYRLILSPLVGNSLLTIILLLLTYPMIGTKMESTMGSSYFLFLLTTISLLTNIIFDVICYILDFSGSPEALFWGCAGFWSVLFGLITIECMQMPDAPRRMMCIPVDIPSKYFPLALYALIALFSGPSIDNAISIALGYLYFYGYLDRLKPSSYYFEELESSGNLLHSVSRQSGWVLAGSALGHDAWIAVNAESIQQEEGTARGQNMQRFRGNEADGKQEPKDLFPGSGHKLNNSETSSIFPSFTSLARETVASPPVKSNSSSLASSTGKGSAPRSASIPSREELAARRLAALQNNTNYSTSNNVNN